MGRNIESDSCSVDIHLDPNQTIRIMGKGGVSVTPPSHIGALDGENDEPRRSIGVRFYVEDYPPDVEDREPTGADGYGAVYVTREEARELGEALLEAADADSQPLFETADTEELIRASEETDEE